MEKGIYMDIILYYILKSALFFIWPIFLSISTIYFFILGWKKEFREYHPFIEFTSVFTNNSNYWSEESTVHNSIIIKFLHFILELTRIFTPLHLYFNLGSIRIIYYIQF